MKILFRTFWFLGTLCALTWPKAADARPEYALKTKLSCVSCHDLPMGGGPRNLMGKTYGSHDHPPALTSSSDLYYGDFRSEAYYPWHKTTEQQNGLALMVAAATANVPITRSDDGSSLRALLTVDFGVLSNGTREALLIWKTPDGSGVLAPDYVLFGRFYPAFGLLTDEHRTYTKIQTLSSIRDYEFGAQFTWLSQANLQVDLALTQGFASGGAFADSDLTFAVIPDIRWNPPSLPFLVGASAGYHRTVTRAPSPYAYSLYAGFSVGRVTQDKVPLTLLAELAVARHWNRQDLNPRLGFFFEGDLAYPSLVANAQSIGFYGEAVYDLSSQFALTYKFDRLQFNASFGGDAYARHGAGFRWHFASNLSLYARVEFANVGREEAKATRARAVQDDVIAMLRFWL